MWRGGTAAEFLGWWCQQLRDLVPQRWRLLFPAGEKSLRVEVERLAGGMPAAVALSLHRKGRIVRLGRFLLDEEGTRAAQGAVQRSRIQPVVLQLPRAVLLDLEVTLPLAAERDPGQVLRYEMDRLTPFATDEVFWSWAIEGRTRALGRVQLRLWLVPKAAIEPLLGVLARIGAAPSVLEGRNHAGAVLRIALNPTSSQRDHQLRQARIAGWTGCAVLAAAAIALPFLRQGAERVLVDARITALRPLVAEVQDLRRRIRLREGGGDVVAAERARVGDVFQALGAVTDLLPDDTFLTELLLRKRKLTLYGQSAAAPKLIAKLSGGTIIRNPEFVAPVRRAENGRVDLFSIRTELAP